MKKIIVQLLIGALLNANQYKLILSQYKLNRPTSSQLQSLNRLSKGYLLYSEGFAYEIKGLENKPKYVIIEYYLGADKNVVIPSYLGGHAVTEIRFPGFNMSQVESVIIPETVRWIGRSAFWDCNSLVNVDIPSNVEYIDSTAFIGTPFLENKKDEELVIINGNLIKFNDLGNKNIVIPDNVKIIGVGVFQQSTIESVYIPDSVEIIEDYAFYPCRTLQKVYCKLDSVAYHNFGGAGSNVIELIE